ncbi:hypothetical protein BDR03DRAFT_937173 [Suillus americanus]|nr:hypothetical protein BDR03DRAFT_937173 [Suillus americanus]
MYSRRHRGALVTPISLVALTKVLPSRSPIQVRFKLCFTPTYLLRWLSMSLPVKVESWMVWGCLVTLLKWASS